jgi:translocation and assembly module TamA
MILLYTIRRLWPCLFTLLISLPLHAADPNLRIRIQGVDGELQENIRAWLGAVPESAAQRLNFLSSAEEMADKALQALGYFQADISSEVQRTDPVWQLRLVVQANDPVRIRQLDVQILGEAGQSSAYSELLVASELGEARVFHQGRYTAFKNRLLALGQRKGFFEQRFIESQVEVSVADNSADIRMVYDSGPRYAFGPTLYSSEQMNEELFEALRTFDAGDPFDLDRLQALQGSLQQTGYFSSVIIRPRLDEAQGTEVPVLLELHPAKSHRFNVGVGYRTDVEERFSVVWRTPRINAAGHSQETRLEYSRINPSGRLSYNIPLQHPLNDILQFTARVEDNEFGDLDSSQQSLGVRREKRHNNWIYSYGVRALNESWEVASLHRNNNYLLGGFTLSRRDRWGSIIDPRRAFSQFYELETGSEEVGSDIDLVRSYARWGYVDSFGQRHRIVGRAELGAVFINSADRLDLAPSLGFFAGGSNSLRGFSYQSIGVELEDEKRKEESTSLTVGAERLLTGSLEYQYDVSSSWRAAAFVDFGDAFDQEDFEANYAVGFGAHFLTQVGPIRLQLAYPLSKDDPSWQFHLDIGADF